MTRLHAALIALLCLTPTWVAAQGTSLDFGGLKTDTTLPVEVTADQLTVNQADGMAEFTGSVLVSQGDMRLQAGKAPRAKSRRRAWRRPSVASPIPHRARGRR